jgi:hypothetical protein
MSFINGHPDMTQEGLAAVRRALGDQSNKPMFFQRGPGFNLFCHAHDVENCAECQAVEKKLAAARKAQQHQAERVENVESWHRAACRSEDGLGGMTNHQFADYENPEYFRRACGNGSVFNGIKALSLRDDAIVAGPTGSAKTTGVRARVLAEYKALLKAAHEGPVSLPPRITYCTGYELTEASKRRSLGDAPHGLTRAAMRAPMLVLDEVHSLHTSLNELFAVLDVRDRAGLPTIFLTGMTITELGAWVGAAALRRVLKGEVIDGYAEPKKVRAVR